MLGLRLLALVLLVAWMLLVGRWGGVALLALVGVVLQRLTVAQTAQSDGTLRWGYSLSFHQTRWQQHREMWLWLLLAGALFTALTVTDNWLFVRWFIGGASGWLLLGRWRIALPRAAVWWRWLAIVALPWICYDPLTLLYWTARTEQRTPKAREAPFGAADIASVPDERGQPLAQSRTAATHASQDTEPEFEGVYPPTPVASRLVDDGNLLP